jgi:hypothetical protein
MRIEKIDVYISDDGKKFFDEKDCIMHEVGDHIKAISTYCKTRSCNNCMFMGDGICAFRESTPNDWENYFIKVGMKNENNK